MERPLVGKRPTFRPAKSGLNVYRVMLWISLILACTWYLLRINRGEVISPLEPTPTPTRMATSYLSEAEAYFQAGKLDDPDPPSPGLLRPDAIDTLQRALQMDPNDPLGWAALARIQAYSTTMLSTDDARQRRLEEAVQSVDRAIELDPEDSNIQAIRAFVYDW